MTTDVTAGESLFFCARTVEIHVAHIFAKLGVRSRTSAVDAARDAGLLNPAFVSPATGPHETQ